METRIQHLETRITNLEQRLLQVLDCDGVIDPPKRSIIQRTIEDHKSNFVTDGLIKIQNLFIEQCHKMGLSLKNFTKVCRYCVEFIDRNIPEIIEIVGMFIPGAQKLSIAINLVHSLFHSIDVELIEQTIQSAHTLIYPPAPPSASLRDGGMTIQQMIKPPTRDPSFENYVHPVELPVHEVASPDVKRRLSLLKKKDKGKDKKKGWGGF